MRTFQAFGREFEYKPDIGERVIEIPIAVEILSHWNSQDVIEVGSNMVCHEHMLPNGVQHRVVDLFDKRPKVENLDACDIDYTGKNVLCVSTLEHFDMPEYGNTVVGGTKGQDCFLKIVGQSNEFFITLPIGHNLKLDQWLQPLLQTDWWKTHSWTFKQVNGPTASNINVLSVWEQQVEIDWLAQYNQPFKYANVIVALSNIPWIVSHETNTVYHSP